MQKVKIGKIFQKFLVIDILSYSFNTDESVQYTSQISTNFKRFLIQNYQFMIMLTEKHNDKYFTFEMDLEYSYTNKNKYIELLGLVNKTTSINISLTKLNHLK